MWQRIRQTNEALRDADAVDEQNRRLTGDERREMRDERRQTRDERRQTTDERQATSDERRETQERKSMGNLDNNNAAEDQLPAVHSCSGILNG